MNPSVAQGQILADRYRVGAVLGEGGMGVVFEGTHLGLDAPVAIKVIRPDFRHDVEFVLRFINEAKTAASLKSEHIARVYDVGQLESGEPYLVMERLDGVGLDALLELCGPLGSSEAIDMVLQVCDGLAEAHALSLVHRDIKPANLFLSRRLDGRSVLKILDFGISKRLVDQARRGLTDPARSLGSPWYMSPEQMRDPSRVDQRADIWSLGVLLFELLTNEHPFDGTGVPEVCAQVIGSRAPSLRNLKADVEPALDAIVLRCLEKKPERRFQTVEALADALRGFAHPAADSRRSSRSSRSSLGSLAPIANQQRPTHSAWSTLLVGLGILVVASGLVWLAAPDAQQRYPVPAWSQISNARWPFDPKLAPGPLPQELQPERGSATTSRVATE